MSAGAGLWSSLLNDLDIVAMTFETGASISYPAGAKYGIITSVHNMVIPFMSCIKVGLKGVVYLSGFSAASSGIAMSNLTISTDQSTYGVGSHEVSIIWFG